MVTDGYNNLLTKNFQITLQKVSPPHSKVVVTCCVSPSSHTKLRPGLENRSSTIVSPPGFSRQAYVMPLLLYFLVMVALCNRADHYIFILFLSFFLLLLRLLFFLA